MECLITQVNLYNETLEFRAQYKGKPSEMVKITLKEAGAEEEICKYLHEKGITIFAVIEKEEVKILKNLPETGILDVNETWWKLKESKIMQSINGIGVGKRIRSNIYVDENIIKPVVQNKSTHEVVLAQQTIDRFIKPSQIDSE